MMCLNAFSIGAITFMLATTHTPSPAGLPFTPGPAEGIIKWGGGGGGQISVLICQQLSCKLIILRTSLHVDVINRNARTNIHVSQMHINISGMQRHATSSTGQY